MIINQRDVFEVYFPFPDGQNTQHPVIILSIPRVISCEQTFIGVPISHSEEHNDEVFSFPLSNGMFEKPLLNEDSFVRMHLVTYLRIADLVKPAFKVNAMKLDSFNILFYQIQEIVFGCIE